MGQNASLTFYLFFFLLPNLRKKLSTQKYIYTYIKIQYIVYVIGKDLVNSMSVNLEQNVCMYEQQHYVYPSTILNASSTTLNEPSTTLRVTWTTNHVTSTTLNLISTTLHLPRTTLHVPRTTLHASRTTLHVNSTTIHVYSTTLNVCIPYIQHYKYLWNTKCIQKNTSYYNISCTWT